MMAAAEGTHPIAGRLPLPLRTSADTDGDVARVLAKLEESGLSMKVLRLLANSGAVFRPFVLLSNGLLSRSPLPAADREAMILHRAARWDVQYEWEEHVPMSERAGVTAKQRQAIAEGDVTSLSATQRLAIAVADEIIDNRSLQQTTWKRMRDTWGDEAAFDLILAIGWWGAFVPTLLQAFGLRSIDGED